MAELQEVLARLVERARGDAEFFHRLVFQPEGLVAELDFVDRREKGMILGIKPEDVIAGLAGLVRSSGGEVAECGSTCIDSCGRTCIGSCDDTCRTSCDNTCGARSCGPTTALGMQEFENPEPLQRFNRGLFRPTRRA